MSNLQAFRWEPSFSKAISFPHFEKITLVARTQLKQDRKKYCFTQKLSVSQPLIYMSRPLGAREKVCWTIQYSRNSYRVATCWASFVFTSYFLPIMIESIQLIMFHPFRNLQKPCYFGHHWIKSEDLTIGYGELMKNLRNSADKVTILR